MLKLRKVKICVWNSIENLSKMVYRTITLNIFIQSHEINNKEKKSIACVLMMVIEAFPSL